MAEVREEDDALGRMKLGVAYIAAIASLVERDMLFIAETGEIVPGLDAAFEKAIHTGKWPEGYEPE